MAFRAGYPLTPPYLVLHREEFAWPRMSPYAPVRSYIKPFRAAPFHPSPHVRFQILESAAVRLVCFLLHLSSSRRFPIQDLKFEIRNLEFALTPRR